MCAWWWYPLPDECLSLKFWYALCWGWYWILWLVLIFRLFHTYFLDFFLKFVLSDAALWNLNSDSFYVLYHYNYRDKSRQTIAFVIIDLLLLTLFKLFPLFHCSGCIYCRGVKFSFLCHQLIVTNQFTSYIIQDWFTVLIKAEI